MRTLILTALLSLAAAGGAAAQDFVVVVNASADASMGKSQVADIFMKKTTGWAPVDLDKGNATRVAFSSAVLGRDVSAVQAYWQQQIFAGRDVPPTVKASDADVLAHVRSNPKGIGYVAAGTPLGEGVKKVPLN